jgi:protein-tyrosine phosphatase
MKILMVCLGNICRSPLAEGILKDKIKKNHLGWMVDSAGTGGYHIGSTPDKRSIDIAHQNGIDLSDQRARKVRSTDFVEYDLIYAMDSANYQDLLKQALEEEKPKIKLILNESYPSSNRSVPDPYYGGEEGFQNVFDMLEEACESIVKKYNREILIL